MKTVTVVAVKDFVHEGRRYRRGDNVTMTAIEAAVEAQSHNVSLMERPRPAVATYARRDMVAESPQAPSMGWATSIQEAFADRIDASLDENTQTKRKPRRRRTRRADMVTEP